MYSNELAKLEDCPKWHKIATSRNITRTHSMKALNMCMIFLSILCSLLGIAYVFFNPIVKHIILQKLVLTNSSDFAQIWENPPIEPHLKIFFFNLTNAEDFFQGNATPKLVEVGPYTYHQRWIKENIKWHNNGTMSYSTRKLYKFMPDLSVGDPTKDIITTLNVPLLSAYYQMRESGSLTVWLLDALISELNYDPWVTKSVEDLVWGYDETLFAISKAYFSNPPTSDKFGFFSDKNNSANLPTYTMFTGENDPYKLSRISLFNGDEHLKFWSEDQCNVVRGSDGATFNPYIQKKDTLWFFNDQLCRSIPMVFQEEVLSSTLPGYRFAPRDDVFKSPITYPENSCFCVDEDLCDMIGDGFFGISACQFNAPIVLSWPHFLGANESFINAVEGMKPRKDQHGFWFDVQPITGTTLSAKARVQINMAIKRTDSFATVSKISDTVMPILWFEEGLDELGPELVNHISTAVHSPPQYRNYVLCVFIGLFVALSAITAVSCVGTAVNKRKKDLDTVRNIIQLNMIEKNHDPNMQKVLLESNSSSGIGSSVESSRTTSANHSRNTSTGSSSLKTEAELHTEVNCVGTSSVSSSTSRPASTLIAVMKDGLSNDREQLEKLLEGEDIDNKV